MNKKIFEHLNELDYCLFNPKKLIKINNYNFKNLEDNLRLKEEINKTKDQEVIKRLKKNLNNK